MPQVLPVLQAEADGLKDNPLLAFPREAKVETFFLTSLLWQIGQVTSVMILLRNNSSKLWPHWLQTNSNNGIPFSPNHRFPILDDKILGKLQGILKSHIGSSITHLFLSKPDAHFPELHLASGTKRGLGYPGSLIYHSLMKHLSYIKLKGL